MTNCPHLQSEVDIFVKNFELRYLKDSAGLTQPEAIGYLTAMAYYADGIICPTHETKEILLAVRSAIARGVDRSIV